MTTLIQQTFGMLAKAFSRLEQQVPPPVPVEVHDGFVLRYKEKSVEQALLQKLARYISGLHSIFILLNHGFLQEQGVLQRTLDEFHEDILFLALGITNDKITDLHKRYLEAFYAEDFSDFSDPVGSLVKRDMVPREKIRAYLSRAGHTADPHTEVTVAKTISSVYSGFVHAASPHIMDMCGGVPLRFHTAGLLGTPRMEEHEYDIWNYFYRGLCSTIIVGKAFGDAALVKKMSEFCAIFEETSGRDFGFKRSKSSGKHDA